ncbi:MAG TPA: DEAD/DEAH box helicase [Dermatophilaceae bacterium]|nr:DEAD/DEAH box helicase [Dermatophilaceae bacterium]
MPKVTRPGAPKKARWTAAQKAAAAKKPHRGQGGAGSPAAQAGPGQRPTRSGAARTDATRSQSSRDDADRGSRPGRTDRPERSFRSRDDRPERGYRPRDERAERSFRSRDERPERTYRPRDERGERPFRPAEQRPERPYRAARPQGDGWAPRQDRPYQPRDDRGERPYRSREERAERPFRSRDERGGERSFRPREERADRPFRSRDDQRGERSFRPREERADRPFRSRDDRPERPFRPRDDERGERSFRPRAERGERTFSARDDRPGRPFRSRDDRRPRRHGERAAYQIRGDQVLPDPEAERMAADTWVSSARKAVSDHPVEIAEDNGFAVLGLPTPLVERLARDGITEPFPIQTATIPDALAGRDLLGRGQTGSGKTLAFGLAVLTRLAESAAEQPRQPRRPRALVLVPTRELAMQVSDALEPLVHVLGLRHKLVAGGLSYTGQINALQRGVDLLIATPGRLVDLQDRGAVELGSVGIVVLDEADHMAEMGFVPELTALLDQVPDGGQRLLFSATLDYGVDDLVTRYLTDPVTHSTDDATASVTTMSHWPLLITPDEKKPLTAAFAAHEGRVIVFARTQLGAERVARQLREAGVLAAPLHGGLTQSARNKALGAFREARLPVLVATDVAARGIHVDDVSLVLQVDPPADHKDYLHRSGRTARAGEQGSVVTLVLPHQRKQMERMLKDAGLEEVPTKATSGDQLTHAAGARQPSGIPVTDEALRAVLDPDLRRGPGGARGPRHGRSGGFRPHHQGGRRDRQAREGSRVRD